MIYLSLGSNIGNRLAHLQRAVLLLKERCLKNMKLSIVLETVCILPENAPTEWDKPFFNMIVSGDTSLSPEVLLSVIKSIEQEIGRPKNYERWSPRIIDIDILLWDDTIISLPHVKIPHPDLKNRSFLMHLLALMGEPYPTDNQCFLRSFCLFPPLVGIVNVTADSFSDGGLYEQSDNAIQHAIHLVEEGASIVDIGAQSTRPGAILKTPEEEYAQLKPVLDGLQSRMVSGEIKVSVDTFWPQVIHNVLDNYAVSWINDVKGNLDETTLRRIALSSCSLCCMHSLTIPPSQDNVLTNDKPAIEAIIEWGKRKTDYLISLGFQQKSIIIDPGIGFGKTIWQNISLLQQIETLKSLGVSILVGHSRKSYIRAFSQEEAQNRDLETMAISAAIAEKVDFLRVHNVADHQRFFVASHFIRRTI